MGISTLIRVISNGTCRAQIAGKAGTLVAPGGKDGRRFLFPSHWKTPSFAWVAPTPTALSDMQTDHGSLTQILQSSLNNTRKTEQRVLSLNKALLEREELWKKHEADMRQAYRREYGRFHRDMERLRDDLQKANAAQAGARAELLRVFNHGPQLEADTVDADRAYDQMMVGWMAETDGLDARSVLQRALGAAPSAGAGRDFAGGPMQVETDPGLLQTFGAPIAPPGLTASAGILPSTTGVHLGGPPLTASTPVAAPISAPAVPEGYTGAAAKDPYMMSPSAHGGPGALPSPSHHYKAVDGSRVSVKTRPQTGPPPTGGQSLGSKLEARRHALAPFGLAAAACGPLDSVAAASGVVMPAATEAPFLSDQEIQARLHTFAGSQVTGVIDDDGDEDEPT